MKFIYHYCAIFKVLPGEVSYVDGLIMRETKIETYDEYTKLKREIIGMTIGDPTDVTITSLTLIS